MASLLEATRATGPLWQLDVVVFCVWGPLALQARMIRSYMPAGWPDLGAARPSMIGGGRMGDRSSARHGRAKIRPTFEAYLICRRLGGSPVDRSPIGVCVDPATAPRTPGHNRMELGCAAAVGAPTTCVSPKPTTAVSDGRLHVGTRSVGRPVRRISGPG